MGNEIREGQRLLEDRRREMGINTTHPQTTTCSDSNGRKPGQTSKQEKRTAPTTSTCPKTSGPDEGEEAITPDCEICRDLGWVKLDVGPEHPQFGKFVPCQCRKEEIARRRMERLAHISGLMEEELALTLDDVKETGADTAKMERAAREFLEEPYGFLTIYGGVGNGKTLILQALVNELREGRGLEGAYITFKDLIDFMRAGFDDDTFTERDRYEYLRDVPVLAIDEIDKARMTAYSDEFRSAFLDYRYRLGWNRKAATIMAMNCAPEDLPPHIYDRLRDGRFTVIENRDRSMRPAMRG